MIFIHLQFLRVLLVLQRLCVSRKLQCEWFSNGDTDRKQLYQNFGLNFLLLRLSLFLTKGMFIPYANITIFFSLIYRYGFYTLAISKSYTSLTNTVRFT